MTLPTTNLGKTGLTVSRLVLGTMTFGLQTDEETSRVILFVNQFRWWYVAMVILEVIHATCDIMLPYAIGEIIRSVTRATGDSRHIFDVVRQPLMLFTASTLRWLRSWGCGQFCWKQVTRKRSRQPVKLMLTILSRRWLRVIIL